MTSDSDGSADRADQPTIPHSADDDAPTAAIDAGGLEDTVLQTRVATGGGSEPVASRYRLRDKLGEGGMGQVWLADQTEPVRRQVAVKLIKRGMDSEQVVRRFEAERQALALMEHPSIAKVFDAGTLPDGRPFFAMELVKGIPIHRYCDEHRLGLRSRLELFVEVCGGVQHAHHKAIIHRDLKPSNVLVTDHEGAASPRIIDFGVAKATAVPLTEKTMHTHLGTAVGTLEYMSPEQAAMSGEDVDTRTDVYSLGVLLYQLLVGRLPFESKELRSGSFDEIRRHIREVNPPSPSSRASSVASSSDAEAKRRRLEPAVHAKRLKGDLDWIVMKAMEKDRTRRYGSPAELAADIERHLRHEPVLASPPSVLYRFGKLVQRRRMASLFTAALLLVVLLAGVGLAVQAQRLRQERDRANQEATSARKVTEFLVDLFEVSDPEENLGETITAREILDRGAEQIAEELDDQPEIKATMLTTLARVYEALGLYESAEGLARQSTELVRRELENDHRLRADTLTTLGNILFSQGRFGEDVELLAREAVEHAIASGDPQEESYALMILGNVLLQRGELDEAAESYERARRIVPPDADPDGRASLLNNLSLVHLIGGDYRAAERELLALLELIRKRGDRPGLSDPLNNLGAARYYLGEFDRAAESYRESLAIDLEILGEDHPRIATTLDNLGETLYQKGDYEGAEEHHRRALEMGTRSLGEEHPALSLTRYNLANVLVAIGRLDEAAVLMRTSLEQRRDLFEAPHREISTSLSGMARVLHAQGELGQAEVLYREAHAMEVELYSAEHLASAETRTELGRLLLDTGRTREAIAMIRPAVEAREKDLASGHWHTAWSRAVLEAALAREREIGARERLAAAVEVLDARGMDTREARLARSYLTALDS